ncbi:type II toxin-antitoxin system RelE/ParE family toxin [uncultured Gelidibacter sp.]|uniref:type II toxin-antitoxin system RelE/ParE family toxin n=1 Tax=uncultured Gelidibacter sp. TaxID=259318 RepID=UPI0026050201|nr:type II toxin-antitoxin system RelE/ParE family toxin [uncultured Gelidibacter sp.]
MVQINWTHQSVADLRAIFVYISKDSKNYAKLQIIRIKKRTKILHSQIYSGQIVPEINKHHTRQLIEGHYRIIYKVVTPSRIDILTVHHSARNLENRIS